MYEYSKEGVLKDLGGKVTKSISDKRFTVESLFTGFTGGILICCLLNIDSTKTYRVGRFKFSLKLVGFIGYYNFFSIKRETIIIPKPVFQKLNKNGEKNGYKEFYNYKDLLDLREEGGEEIILLDVKQFYNGNTD